MTLLTNHEINEIRNAVDIVDIIGEYIPLIQKGRNFFGICPFHSDHNPSMSVSREKQIYKCFSCGASGNVFTFIMEYENVDFIEALNFLANKAGIKINKNVLRSKNKDVHGKLFEIHDISTKYYQNNLNTSSGIKAKKYLKNRDISEDIIKEFQIGFANDKMDILTNLLLSNKFTEKEIIDSGISNKNDLGFNDVFINRIMFPLWDTSGRVIGYSGRVYTDTDMAKYVNTKETNIFKKGMLLYNYHRAKEEIRTKKSLILVEGFMDVIRCYSVGIKNVVAIMGTSITEQQMNLIKKLSNNVILCFDGDSAGNNATFVCGDSLSKSGVNLKVISLSDSLDPDEYIQKYGKKAFELATENAVSFIDFKLNYLKSDKDFNNSDDIAKYVNEVLLEISKITDEIKVELLLTKISKEFLLSKETLVNKLNKHLKVEKQKTRKDSSIIIKVEFKNKYHQAELRLLYYMLKAKEIIRMYECNVAYLPSPHCRMLANEIISYSNEYGEINIADFITYLGDKRELINLITELEIDSIKDDYSMEEIEDYINTLKEYSVKNEIKRLESLMKSEFDIFKKALHAENIRKLRIEE